MRLVCPNCDAQYEVADTAIPEAGRDVQCSNCGHAWFQMPPQAEAEAAEEANLFGDDIAALTDTSPPAYTPPEPPAQPAAAQPAPPPPAFAEPEEDEGMEAPVPAAPMAEAKPRGLDESLLAVLREEAEREVQARRVEEPRALETQTEMGLEAASSLSPTQRRLAMLKGQNPDAAPPPPPKPAARRDLLPDVEEINSTLRSTTQTRDADEQIDALPDLTRPRSGFKSGFVLMLILAVVFVVAYVAAPRLAEQFPASADMLNRFVAQVDAIRLWLDGIMQQATTALNGRGA
ncbi:MAG: zinc-ribbon domain-containing protein [Pseudomonadota bacterium]